MREKEIFVGIVIRVYQLSLVLAEKFNIDLIFFGEEPNEYTDYFKLGDFSYDLFNTKNKFISEKNYHRVTTLGITAKDMEYILKYENNEKFTERDFWPLHVSLKIIKKIITCIFGYFH